MKSKLKVIKNSYTLNISELKDFWFLKCHLVKNYGHWDTLFYIKENHLVGLNKTFTKPIGHYGDIIFNKYKPDFNVLTLIVHQNTTEGIYFGCQFDIHIPTGVVTLKLFVSVDKSEYIQPPELPDATMEWILKNTNLDMSKDDTLILKLSAQNLFSDMLYKRYANNFQNWLMYLSGLPRNPDSSIPPCSLCVNKFKRVLMNKDYCDHLIYKLN